MSEVEVKQVPVSGYHRQITRTSQRVGGYRQRRTNPRFPWTAKKQRAKSVKKGRKKKARYM